MFLSQLKEILWGVPATAVFTAFGVYFAAKTGLYDPRAVLRELKRALCAFGRKGENGVSPFAAAATALGGTVGAGSIVGVGYGIAVGGAGSVFWLWVFSFFATGLKYAETAVSLRGREQRGGTFCGGAPFRLRALGYKKLAALFCVACVLCSFGTGNAAQTGAAAQFLFALKIPRLPAALICAGAVGAAVCGGGKRVIRFNSRAVPFASAVYLCACIALLCLNARGLPGAFAQIFTQAFGFKSAAGGFSGALLSAALREGCARSVFSTEAGMGSAPLAHSASGGDAKLQCSFSVLETVFDTFAVSTLTALCLLCGGSGSAQELFTREWGAAGGLLFGAAAAAFAFASVISWSYYAETCVYFLFCGRKAPLYVFRALFAAAAGLGALFPTGAIIAVSDVLNLFMAAPNLFLLYKCRKEVTP
ncbi:MAG: sodium:alanine symporter family protein [Clostridia bacterium]|nr:sodium:alanine symporter family protein [Clostridia bacterium]